MARRDEILTAVYEAHRLHKLYDAENSVKQGAGRIDVYDMLVRREIPVLFRPLKNLLGAYLDLPDPGIVVTTQRPLTVQRFTAAHELGHAVLGHKASLDEEDILTRTLFTPKGTYDPLEVQANAFATELLTPAWLVVHHMALQGWTREHLEDPVVVYQLALRMGSSYSATGYALLQYKAISYSTYERLRSIRLRDIKQQLVAPYRPTHWYGDVWVITNRDHNHVLEGSRSDLVVFRVQEHAGSGYIWNFQDIVPAGLAIREDNRVSQDEHSIGGILLRTVVAEARDRTTVDLHLNEIRPWVRNATPLNSLEINFGFHGPTPLGLLPAQRQALLGVP